MATLFTPKISLSEAFNQSHAQKNKLKAQQNAIEELSIPSSPFHRRSLAPFIRKPLKRRTNSSERATETHVLYHSDLLSPTVGAPPSARVQSLQQTDISSRRPIHASKSTGNLRQARSEFQGARSLFEKDLPPLPPTNDLQQYDSGIHHRPPQLNQVSFSSIVFVCVP